MSRPPVSSRGLTTSPGPRKPPSSHEESYGKPNVPALASSMSLARSTAFGGRGVTHVGVCTASSSHREVSWGSCFSSRMVAGTNRTTAPWAYGRQLKRAQAPPRLAPLAETPVLGRECGLAPTIPAPLTLSVPPQGASGARRRAHDVAGAGTTSVGSARAALPLLPFSTVATATGRVAPGPVWRRSKPLTRLSSTTVGRALGNDILRPGEMIVSLCDESFSKDRGKAGDAGVSLLPLTRQSDQDPDLSYKRRFSDKATSRQTDDVDRSPTVSVATESRHMSLQSALVPLVRHPEKVSTQPLREAEHLASPPTGDLEEVRRANDQDAIDVSTSSSPPLRPSSALISGNGVGSNADGILWAHEAPEQPAYAHKHQLPALFSKLVHDMQTEKPEAGDEGSGSPVERWIQSWFARQCIMQSLSQPSPHSAKQLHGLDIATVGARVAGACRHVEASADHSDTQEELAAEKELRDAARDGDGPCPAVPISTAPIVTPTTTTKPASASYFKTSSTASPLHPYVPLTVEYIHSGVQSRMTSGTSQRETTPPKPQHTKPHPAPSAVLHTTSSSGTLRPRPHSEDGGGGGVLVVAPANPSSAPPPPPPPPQPAKPVSGSPCLSAPPSASSVSRKQSVVAAAALTGGIEGDKSAGGIRPKLATKSYAVFAHSTSSSAPKQAAHPHE
ncbi:hypothetical protein JKF63_05136 [Porcisia hertigi]|uniref:Uncharacterized protein n=1 Tax=Porcisia hertigi TaxID=2761500 RepID=A0A836IJH0_9TRYP|nr:hypothetical protein JKF63_05136 [Porcisia hertigi]